MVGRGGRLEKLGGEVPNLQSALLQPGELRVQGRWGWERDAVEPAIVKE
jgi:hypothetical protein